MNLTQIKTLCNKPFYYYLAGLMYAKLLNGNPNFFPKSFFDRVLLKIFKIKSKNFTEIVRFNLSKIVGLEGENLKFQVNTYIWRRCLTLILNKIIIAKYYEHYKIKLTNCFESDFEDGGVFILFHTVDAYALPAVVARTVSKNLSKRVYLLRKALSPEEDAQFDYLAKWQGVDKIGDYLNPRSSADIKQAIRNCKQGQSLLSFADMPASFGISPSVTFFNRQAWISLGAIDIARAAKKPIYIAYFSRNLKLPCQLNLCIEKLDPSESKCAQMVVNKLESVIRGNPSDWDFISSLKSYYYHPGR